MAIARRDLVPPDPPLSDGEVMLRPVADDDVDQIYEACLDPTLERFIPVPQPYGRAQAEQYVARTHRQWASGEKAAFSIVEPDDPAHVLGVISTNLAGTMGNAGYWVAPAARGRGIAARALRLVSSWAFATLDLSIIVLEIDPENEASMAVARAAGYHRSGRLDLDGPAPGGGAAHTGRLIYSRLVSDPTP